MSAHNITEKERGKDTSVSYKTHYTLFYLKHIDMSNNTFTPCAGYFTSPGIYTRGKGPTALVSPPKDTG